MKKSTFDFKQISRRDFIGSSIKGSLAASLGGKLIPPDVQSPTNENERNGLTLRVGGDQEHGYYVTILFNRMPIAYYNGRGEFSAVFENGDRSLEDHILNWRAWQPRRILSTGDGTA